MDQPQIEFFQQDQKFKAIIGPSPSFQLLAEASDGTPLYHEACVYNPATSRVYVTSNQCPDEGARCGKRVKLTEISLDPEAPTQAKVKVITPSALEHSFLNGGVNFGDGQILFCAQGSTDPNDLSGLIAVSANDSSTVTPILTSFHGIPFNSVNDAVVHPKDNSIWFTDPCYGYHQGIRPKPQLPNQVYRFDPNTKSVRAVADGFTRPNGICFSPDATTVYITDTGAIHGSSDVPIDLAGPSHIYAFDLVDGFLVNKRLFAYAPGRFPDGIKCDMRGNVYAGCGDGVDVWDSKGVLLGAIKVAGGVANFCFGKEGEMFLCNETKFWRVQLGGEGVKGALLGI